MGTSPGECRGDMTPHLPDGVMPPQTGSPWRGHPGRGVDDVKESFATDGIAGEPVACSGRVTARPLVDDAGRRRDVAFFLDMTERKRAEQRAARRTP